MSKAPVTFVVDQGEIAAGLGLPMREVRNWRNDFGLEGVDWGLVDGRPMWSEGLAEKLRAEFCAPKTPGATGTPEGVQIPPEPEKSQGESHSDGSKGSEDRAEKLVVWKMRGLLRAVCHRPGVTPENIGDLVVVLLPRVRKMAVGTEISARRVTDGLSELVDG